MLFNYTINFIKHILIAKEVKRKMNQQNGCCSREPRTNSTSTANSNYILETVRNIDRMQREASSVTGCITCNDLLISNAVVYNTKPVRFALCSGSDYEAYVGVGGTLTNYFRIQEVRGNNVILRLLSYSTETSSFTCTNYTTILDLRCVCAIQCFPAINCECCLNAINE